MKTCIRNFVLSFLFCAAPLLQGCPPPFEVEIYNALGRDLVVRMPNEDEEWLRETAWKSGNSAEGMRWAKVSDSTATVPILQILDGDKIESYALQLFPLPDTYLTNGGSRRVYLMLERDAKLYLASREGSVLKILFPQPPKFPIAPDRSN